MSKLFFFWNELKDRIEGKNAKDAAIEVNYWCAEEATYHSGDDRTLPALTVYRRGYGRCGEESVFLVNALRSVGIPARQVYVPGGPTVMTTTHGWSFGVTENGISSAHVSRL